MDIQPHDFRFTLYTEGKEWVLPQAPEGWEESTLQWARSSEYFGMIRTFSVPLKFVLDGAWLLRRVMYREGVDGSAVLKIELLNRKTWVYDLLYEGDVDFSTFEDVLSSVEAKLMEMGISASIAAFSNVDYEWPVLPEDTVQVRLPGIDRIETGSSALFALNANTFGYYPGVEIVSNELFTEKVIMQAQPFGIYIPPSTPGPGTWFLEGQDPVTETRVFGYFDYFHLVVPGYWYQIELVTGSNTTVAVLFTTQGTPPAQNRADFDITLNIPAGQQLWIMVKRYGSGSFIVTPFLRLDGASVSVSYGITTEPSIISAYKPKRLFQMLIDRMHDEEIEVQSGLLEQWDNLLITSGDAIRTITGAMIKTNFNDFFKSLNAVLNIGFGITNGVPIIEPKNYFFRPILMALDLGDSVKDVSIRPAEEFMFNSIKAGYPNDDYDVDQGREEYNSGQIWATNIKRLQKQIDLSSVYRADQYGIEQLRITILDNERDNVNEVDKKNDNEVFFIHAQKTPGEDGIYDVIGVEAYLNVSGISARSSSYNLGITPKKNLLRHADYLAGALYNNSADITFESADKNAELSTTSLTGVTVQENTDIAVSDLGDPLFLPFKVDLTTDLQFDAWKLLQNNSTGYIRFVWREFEFYGFLLDVSQNIERNSERAISLILTPNSDITKLIF